ncbi:MAG: FKBP-type peptidyl-prolyl cis-trans isomerase [Actinomycetota bacterium]|nr:FKBP-type peptidyl-prolyl cis-trans isomerase [Actinomycetota bacterium]
MENGAGIFIARIKEIFWTGAVFLTALLCGSCATSGTQPVDDGVKKGDLITTEYVLMADGRVIHDTREMKSFVFRVGAHQVVPGFDKAVIGMRPGQQKKVVLTPEEGFGQYDPKKVVELPSSDLPSGIQPGMSISYRLGPSGGKIPVKILAVKKNTVVLDLNNPLAGKTLYLTIRLDAIDN